MGDTHHDPTDRHRSAHPRAGLVMKDNFFWPGFILVAVALNGIIDAVLVAAYHHYEWLTPTVLVAVLGSIAAALWFTVELRHVAQLEKQSLRMTTARCGDLTGV